MNREEWVAREFSHDSTDKLMSDYIKQSRERYFQNEIDRRWKASNVEKLSNHTWLVDLRGTEEDNHGLSVVIINWCRENCEGGFSANNPVWWEFELETDAMAFKLAWGD